MKTESSAQNQRALQISAATKNANYAVIVSRFNDDITSGLLVGAQKTFEEFGIGSRQIQVIYVPGAFEIPLVAKDLITTHPSRFAGIICLGAVIKGDTAHFEYVCQGLTQGLMSVMLETKTPLAFGVLTTLTLEQAQIRAATGTTAIHSNKGREATLACLETAELLLKNKTL